MNIITEETRLSDALLLDAALIPLAGRFGIKLGVGDDTVEEVCSRHGISTPFFCAVVNTFLHAEYMPEADEDMWQLAALSEYLQMTDMYYAKVQIPNIQRHMQVLIDRSGDGTNLPLIMRYFLALKEEFDRVSASEREGWWPSILSMNKGIVSQGNASKESGGNAKEGSGMQSYNHDKKMLTLHPDEILTLLPEEMQAPFMQRQAIADQVDDIASIFVRHLKGDYDQNLCMGVVNAIYLLRNDMRQNNRIRRRILLPAAARLFTHRQ